MTHSLDFRQQVLKSIKEDGLSYRKAAKFYGTSTRACPHLPKLTFNGLIEDTP